MANKKKSSREMFRTRDSIVINRHSRTLSHTNNFLVFVVVVILVQFSTSILQTHSSNGYTRGECDALTSAPA